MSAYDNILEVDVTGDAFINLVETQTTDYDGITYTLPIYEFGPPPIYASRTVEIDDYTLQIELK